MMRANDIVHLNDVHRKPMRCRPGLDRSAKADAAGFARTQPSFLAAASAERLDFREEGAITGEFGSEHHGKAWLDWLGCDATGDGSDEFDKTRGDLGHRSGRELKPGRPAFCPGAGLVFGKRTS